MDDECLPLKTLQELLAWKNDTKCRGEPLRDKIVPNSAPKTLLCHDMMGGYLEDRFISGSRESNSYRFYHWDKIDMFVYFSHYLVTIPPIGWINAAHKHNVKVLGTFITEWDGGTKLLEQIREENLVREVAAKLADVAAAFGFDGWLMNIESKMDADCGPFMVDFLSEITTLVHESVEGSVVLWYDSIVCDGELKWQNELNDRNRPFFDCCDGIFLNYGWTEENLRRSADAAGGRKTDVFVGIDVFARETKYPGGYETYKAVQRARKFGLSAAIFAPGWVYETQGKDRFTENQYRFWDFPKDLCSARRYTALPLVSTFCQGFGEKTFSCGEVVSTESWYNLSKQELQPACQGPNNCGGRGSATVCTEDGFSGGGCLELRYSACSSAAAKPYFKLFDCKIDVEDDIYASYTFKMLEGSDDDLNLVLKFTNERNRTTYFFLGANAASDDGDKPTAKRQKAESDVIRVAPSKEADPKASNLPRDGIRNGWVTRNYVVKRREHEGTILRKMGIQFGSTSSTQCCLLGRVMVLPAENKERNRQ